MKVRITKSSYPEAWYSKHIGDEFEVEEKKNRHGVIDYILVPRDPNGDFYIDADDCEIVEG